MDDMTRITCRRDIPKRLEDHGVNTIFSMPGVHTVELYKGLAQSNIQHITPHQQQRAGFMADRDARACSKGISTIAQG